MNFSSEIIVSVVFFVWTGVLTILFLKFYLYYRRLSKDGKKESLVEILDGVKKWENAYGKDIEELIKKTQKLEYYSQFYIQKVGLVRFNPFNDTGGDQSFILSLVDSENTGVVISSLHTRGGARWYAKRVDRGKGIDHQLSSEEVKAIAVATSLSKKNK